MREGEREHFRNINENECEHIANVCKWNSRIEFNRIRLKAHPRSSCKMRIFAPLPEFSLALSFQFFHNTVCVPFLLRCCSFLFFSHWHAKRWLVMYGNIFLSCVAVVIVVVVVAFFSLSSTHLYNRRSNEMSAASHQYSLSHRE